MQGNGLGVGVGRVWRGEDSEASKSGTLSLSPTKLFDPIPSFFPILRVGSTVGSTVESTVASSVASTVGSTVS